MEKTVQINEFLKRVGVHEITYSNCSTAGCEIIASLIDNGATLIKSVKVFEHEKRAGAIGVASSSGSLSVLATSSGK